MFLRETYLFWKMLLEFDGVTYLNDKSCFLLELPIPHQLVTRVDCGLQVKA